MDNRISKAFNTPNGKAFIAFLTAGDPDMDSTVSFILEMEKAGADLIEVGIPFSDPIAEGPVIQEADLRALEGGMTTDGAFEVVRRVREKSQIPLVFMTYLNPVFHYGYDRFFAKCEEVGVDGIIIPDLPFEEKKEVDEPALAHNVTLISMIAPTSEERMGVTGVRTQITTDLDSIVKNIRKATNIPCAIGFGISTPDQAAKMAAVSDGSIVGSAIVKIIAQHGKEAGPVISEYVKRMKDAVAGVSSNNNNTLL